MNIIAGRHAIGQHCCVVARCTWQPHMHARRVPFGRRFDPRLKAGIHGARLAARRRFDLDMARTGAFGLADKFVQRLFKDRKPVRIGVTELNLHLGMTWNDATERWARSAMRPIVHTVRGPAILGKRS